MPNITTILREEISRVARKEVRAETTKLKKSSTQYRSHIAALKRRLAVLERQLGRRTNNKSEAAIASDEEARQRQFRFSAKGLASQRQRLGLSARQVATLLGVSQLTVYKWEKGQARPRAKQLESIARLRKMGKREAAALLSEMEG